MKIIIADTFGIIDEALNITPEDGFKNIVEQLKLQKAFLKNAGILVYLDTLIYLFNHLEIAEGYGGAGNTICSNDYTEFIASVQRNICSKVNTVHEAWTELQRALCEQITELYRYGFADGDEDVEYLKSILFFLAYTKILKIQE